MSCPLCVSGQGVVAMGEHSFLLVSGKGMARVLSLFQPMRCVGWGAEGKPIALKRKGKSNEETHIRLRFYRLGVGK